VRSAPRRAVDADQPRLAPAQLVGQLVAALILAVASVLRGVDRLGLLKHRRDLCLEARLVLFHPLVAHRLVLRRVGFHLRPVEGHVPQLHQLRLPAQHQYLEEEVTQRLQVDPPEFADPRMVRVISARQHPERHVLDRLLLDPPRRPFPDAVTVDQQRHHHPRVVRRLPARFRLVLRCDRRQLQLLHHVEDKVRQVLVGQPLQR